MGPDPQIEVGSLKARIAELEAQIKLRTEQLIASTSRAYAFMDSLSMGFIMCDVNPEVVLANDTARRLLAIPGEVTLSVLDELFQPVALQLGQLINSSLASDLSQEFPEINLHSKVLRLFIAPMLSRGDAGETQKLGAVILLEDITEQKVLERSKDEFLSIASHELRTPLTAIRGNSALIQKYYAPRLPDKDVTEMVGDIHESAVRLIEIVNDFLDASALEQGKMIMHPAPFAIQQIADEVCRELKTICDAKNIALEADGSLAALPTVNADKQRIKQVLINLVGNAAKFTEQGKITIVGRADEKFVYISVIDTGRGMPVENQRLLFRKFQQASDNFLTRDTTKGTGLGLYISKLIVQQSGGHIELTSSTPGQGSTFTFTLRRQT